MFTVVQHGTYTDTKQRCATWPAAVVAAKLFIAAAVDKGIGNADTREIDISLLLEAVTAVAGDGETVTLLPNGKTLEITEGN